jgi:mitochondrial fission protein ELM1
MSTYSSNFPTWILNGSVELQSHAMAVAQAVGLAIDLKQLHVTGLMRYSPVWLQLRVRPERVLDAAGFTNLPQFAWPRLLIAVGRRSMPFALSIKSLSQPPCFALHIRKRKFWDYDFDLVTVPLRPTGLLATKGFDAIYNVPPVQRRHDSNVDGVNVVANVVKAALRL